MQGNSQLRLRQQAKAMAVAFGVVIAITVGLLCVSSSFPELKEEDEAYHMTQYLRALDQSAFAEETERESQSTMPVTMPPTNTLSTTPAHQVTREAEQGQIRHLLLGRTIGALLSAISPMQNRNPMTQRNRLRSTMPPANTLTIPARVEAERKENTTNSSPGFTEAESGDASEEIFHAAASRADKNAEAGAGSAAMSDDVEVGDIDAQMHNGEWVVAPQETEESDSEDSDSSSDSNGCSSEDSVDRGSDSDSSDSVSINCNESTSIMNKW
ncbi:unnamed protein product [Peronospora destructor]|uniref:Transmembrane protein n=1 Tax=Peronospora destructor TaxID=86335 RepID=A0AAV0UEY4_9STRA|nr:unnamed protein product [Peronospora destructor]